jgi:hypothetical protein
MLGEGQFYICPICFDVSRQAGSHHGRPMIHCQELPEGHEMLQPEFFLDGNLKSRAPAGSLNPFEKPRVWKCLTLTTTTSPNQPKYCVVRIRSHPVIPANAGIHLPFTLNK